MFKREQSDLIVSIDFEFIRKLEGEPLLIGEVASPVSSKSGVIIAYGFDLAEYSDTDLRKFGLNSTLIGKLYPYLGLVEQEASDYLADFPLELSLNEVTAIDQGFKRRALVDMVIAFNQSSPILFSKIPRCWQTVIASLEFQYGQLHKTCPSFWSWVSNQKWDKALMELQDFGDEYQDRRKAEAYYIEVNSL